MILSANALSLLGRARGARVAPARWLLCVIVFLSAALATPALDPAIPIGSYRVRIWKQLDGLPQNSAVAMTQDPRGYLWVATFGGLARFNGREFTTYPSMTYPCLPTDRIISLLSESDGAFWIGTELHGAAALKDGVFHACPPFKGLEKLSVIAIAAGTPGQTFLGTSGGLFELRDGVPVRRWSEQEGLPPREVSALLSDGRGGLWVGTTDGLAHLRDGSVERIPTGMPPKTIVYALAQRHDGSLWVGSATGLYARVNGRVDKVSLGRPEPRGDVISLLEDRDGGFWVGLRGGGLYRITKDKVEHYSAADGLPADTVHALFEDREGSLWVGTDGGGLLQLSNTRIIADGSPRIRFGAPVRCVAGDGAGGYWIGTRGAPFLGLEHLTSRGLEIISDAKLAKIPGILSLYKDREGTLWLGCEEIGLVLLRGAKLSPGPKLPFNARTVLSISENPGEGLLVGTIGGLFEVPSAAALPRLVPGTEALEIQSIESGDGVHWLGTKTGLCALSASGVKRWTQTEGLSNDDVRALHLDQEGTLWIGTYGGGLNRMEKGRITHFGPESGLGASTISFLAEDRKGRLWMTDNNGIFGVPRRQLDALASGKSIALEVAHFTEDDGMLTRECNGGSQPAGLLTPEGDLVAATINGIALVRTNKIYPNRLVPSVFVEGLSVEGKNVPLGGTISLPPSARNIGIRYAALSYLKPSDIRYKIRLEGSDLEWSEAGSRAEVHYAKLPAGRYRFRVIAANASGVWNTEGASLRFRVEPYFFETWWFMSLCAVALVLALVALFHLRTRVLRVRGENLEAIVATRTVELQEAHDGLERTVETRTHELMATQHDLQEKLETIREAQARLMVLETAIGAMDVGITITDESRRIVYANPAEARMHGYAVEDLIGTSAKSLGPASLHHELDWKSATERWVYRREGLNKRSDGTLFPVHLTSVPVADAKGQPAFLVTFCQDLTEAKQRESQLQEALRDATVGKLAAVVAHQVNTPLAAMKTSLEMLREDAGEIPDALSAIEMLMKQVDKVAQTVRALLGFVRQRSLGETATPFQDVIGSVVRLYESAFQSKGIAVQLDLPEERLCVQGAVADLQEVFLNLFENHREALSRGNTIRLWGRREKDVVVIGVEDDGPGLGPEPEKAFQPFYTTKATGTGLGLAICRNICAAFGGRIEAQNRSAEEGGGCRFLIALPIAGAAETKGEEG